MVGIRLAHALKQFRPLFIDCQSVQELAEHEVSVIPQSRLMMRHVGNDSTANVSVREVQFVAQQVSRTRLWGEEVIAVVEIQGLQVRTKHGPGL
jgi:hypothetical protein